MEEVYVKDIKAIIADLRTKMDLEMDSDLHIYTLERIALQLEEQRDSLLRQLCFVCDKAGFNMVAPFEKQLADLNAEIAKGQT